MSRDAESNRVSDRVRYEHIRAAAADVILLTRGRSRAQLEDDMQFRRAVLHALTEIGEAVANMSDAGRALAPTTAWGSIVQMRHILVHVYWGVRLDRVWDVAIKHVPELMRVAEQAIEALPLPDDLNSPEKS